MTDILTNLLIVLAVIFFVCLAIVILAFFVEGMIIIVREIISDFGHLKDARRNPKR